MLFVSRTPHKQEMAGMLIDEKMTNNFTMTTQVPSAGRSAYKGQYLAALTGTHECQHRILIAGAQRQKKRNNDRKRIFLPSYLGNLSYVIYSRDSSLQLVTIYVMI
jgi:hypothetical protein